MSELHSHSSFRIEQQGQIARAVCHCGWTSPSTTNAGIAGSFWDVHLQQQVGAAE